MIRESTTLDRDVRAPARRLRGWTIALAALAVAVGLVVGLLVGLNWPDAPAATSSQPQPALTVGEMAHPDDYLARYLARHQPTATQPIEAPADDYLARYLARHQNDADS
ncbi:MAG TPA: hypothetical protein VM848_19930 [Acidimicrobiia bacterium]|nr:hypothetical protein [Acidimicrobiia bacterium]